MNARQIGKLAVAIILSEMAGIVGSIFTAEAISGWYTSLNRPEFAPPNYLFGPVWITLYALMGIAAYIVWNKGLERKDVRIALGLFIIQLILNSFWSIIFFGLQSLSGAFAEIIILWVAIVVTMVLFWRISKFAVVLLIPYILWVTFAAFLNYSFMVLN